MNHGAHGEQNAIVQKVFARGSIHIILVAERRIQKGEEILFNYGKKYKLAWVDEYSKLALERKKNKKNVQTNISDTVSGQFSTPSDPSVISGTTISKKADHFYCHLETDEIEEEVAEKEDEGLEKLLEDDKEFIVIDDEDDT